MAESDDRALRIKWLEEKLHLLQGTIEYLEATVEGLQYELRVRDIRIEELTKDNALLRQRLEEQAPPPPGSPTPPSPPPFVKANVPPGRRKRPGRKKGHPAALRPPPPRIDRTVKVPLPQDRHGRRVCPRCRGPLRRLRRHKRVVEDFIPARLLTTCYHTTSGYCSCCKRRVESRHRRQPPAHSLPHGQLGLNTLATVALLRLENRLPFRQVIGRLADEVPGLRICAGAVTKQVQRLARWLRGEREQLTRRLRAAPVVNADETIWRTNGHNGWLWTICDPTHTVYHVDKSRGGQVIRKLLGQAFGGTLVTDFYGAYDKMHCRQQRCLVHLLRELKETAQGNPAFAQGAFHRRCKRLVKQLLLLKSRWDQLSDAAYTSKACRLEDRLEQLAKTYAADDEPDTRRLAGRLLRYQKQLTAFLWDKLLPGTNNAAERALRPAVVARKISGGSRSDKGASAWATVASVLRTARQQGRDVMQTLQKLLIDCWAGKEPGLLAEPP